MGRNSFISRSDNFSRSQLPTHRLHFFEDRFKIKAEKLCIVTQITAGLHRRRQPGKIVCFQGLQIWNADTRSFKNFFKREALFLTFCFESVADGLCHAKRNITSTPIEREWTGDVMCKWENYASAASAAGAGSSDWAC